MAGITIGRTVLYTLKEADAVDINRRRTTGKEIADRIENNSVPLQSMPLGKPIRTWPLGAQAHIGNPAYNGEVYPMIVVRVWPDEYGPHFDGVNGQVLLDGNDTFWATSVKEGTEPGTWHWPVRT
jgi:hypothetical protein